MISLERNSKCADDAENYSASIENYSANFKDFNFSHLA
jgi:hypothetical protein